MMDNKQISATFSLLAKIMDIHGENSFKIKTYSNVAFLVERLPEPLASTDFAAISKIKGIGDSTGKKITELITTGKLSLLEKYIADTPPGVLEMMKVKGIGAKKINTIWKELEIESIGELLYACNENRLSRHNGFGTKTEQAIKEAIEFYLSKQGQLLYKEAIPFNELILELFRDAFPSNNIFSSGQIRCQSETVEELEYVTDITVNDIKAFLGKQTGFHFLGEENEVLRYRMEVGPVIKLFVSSAGKLASKLFLTTGSAEFLQFFQKSYPEIDLEGGTIDDEKNIFETAGLQYIPPFLREDPGIITAAKKHQVPDCIEPADIKGIIHSHSTWSDGKFSIEQMAAAAVENGFEYLVISDHSKSAAYANGLNIERIAAQQKEIDELNKTFAPFKIFKSVESDILTDGSLDYPGEILETFDLVIASVHSGLKMTEEKATARLLKAIENPYTTILGHMTGRLLLNRSGYPVDHKKIIDACVANDVVIEVNANARRLDMEWRWLPYALSKNALISIDPDAHSIEAFHDVRWGVLAAQKGGLTAKQNLSSYSLPAFESFLANRKQGKIR